MLLTWMIWEDYSNLKSLLASTLKSNYFHDKDQIWEGEQEENAIWMWKGMLSYKKKIKKIKK